MRFALTLVICHAVYIILPLIPLSWTSLLCGQYRSRAIVTAVHIQDQCSIRWDEAGKPRSPYA